MTTFYQMQRMVALQDDGWFAVGLPDHAWPAGEQPIGGTATVMNRAGDVAKVYGDGRVVGHRAQAWDAPAQEFYPALPLNDAGAS